jgi:hypothetical protein
MPTVGFEHTIPLFEGAKAVRALDHSAIVIGLPNCIKLERLQWAGHIQRVEGKRIPERNFVGKRSIGKIMKRWIGTVEIYCREILKLRNWKRKSLDRQVLRRHLKKAKTRLRAVAPYEKKKKEKLV